MRNALQEQLLRAGLVKEKEVKEAHKQQRKDDKRTQQPPKGAASKPSPAQLQAQRAAAAKAERDKALNAEREARAARKALVAEIVQLIEPYRRPHNDGEEAYNFVDKGAVKRLYVTANTRAALASGEYAIVRFRSRYAIVTTEGAEAVRARAPEFLVVKHDTLDPADAQAYEDHPIPDDLTW